jgi:hypothetical protein
MNLLSFMAKACHYAQEHIDDEEAWPIGEVEREDYLQCVSYQMACFLAQNTVLGYNGVESDAVLKELAERPMKSERQWTTILEGIVLRLGGWKQ